MHLHEAEVTRQPKKHFERFTIRLSYMLEYAYFFNKNEARYAYKCYAYKKYVTLKKFGFLMFDRIGS